MVEMGRIEQAVYANSELADLPPVVRNFLSGSDRPAKKCHTKA